MKKETSLAQERQAIKQRIFLEHFREAGFLSESAKAAGVSRQIVYYWMDTNPSFAKRFQIAKEESHARTADLVLGKISMGARDGVKNYRNLILKEFGENALKKVLSGKNLTWKDVRS